MRPVRTHEQLGPDFFDRVAPARFPQTRLRYRNQRWAKRVGLDHLPDADWIDHFAQFSPLQDSLKTPLALRYHGHQFGNYNPDLGDGRGFLFAQLHDLKDHRLLDLGTKGSGPTPWSRGGDGKLTLKGGVREVIATSMLEALGVNTSKSFSLIETGEALYRDDEPSPTRGSVLVRLSHSHIRIGTFQRLAFLEDTNNLSRLTQYAIEHYYPHLNDLPQAARVPAFLGSVTDAVARTGAQMIAAGFVHGVLNSDNINTTGESFDYGPWRFLPEYDPGFTAAYFDDMGRYAFGRQPDALAWNLTRLAECLVPLSEIARLEPELNRFWPIFQTQLAMAVLDRLGLEPRGSEDDAEFLAAFFAFMTKSRAPYERVYFDWRGGRQRDRTPLAELYAGDIFTPLRTLIAQYHPSPSASLDHAYFNRHEPRTMWIEDLEALWAPIAAHDDWSVFHRIMGEIAEMGDAYGHGENAGDFTAK